MSEAEIETPANGADGSASGAEQLSELELALRDAEANPVEKYEPQFDPSEAMTCRTLAGMTDYQLEYYIERMQQFVTQGEKALELRRQKLAAGKLEQRERDTARGRQRQPKLRQKKADYGQSVEQVASEMIAAAPKPASEPKKFGKRSVSTKDWLERHHGRIR